METAVRLEVPWKSFEAAKIQEELGKFRLLCNFQGRKILSPSRVGSRFLDLFYLLDLFAAPPMLYLSTTLLSVAFCSLDRKSFLSFYQSR